MGTHRLYLLQLAIGGLAALTFAGGCDDANADAPPASTAQAGAAEPRSATQPATRRSAVALRTVRRIAPTYAVPLLTRPTDPTLEPLYDMACAFERFANDTAGVMDAATDAERTRRVADLEPSLTTLEAAMSRLRTDAAANASLTRARSSAAAGINDLDVAALTQNVGYDAEAITTILTRLRLEQPTTHRDLLAAVARHAPSVHAMLRRHEAMMADASADTREASAVSQMQTIRSQIELYRVQHNGPTALDLRKGWVQLINPTDGVGNVRIGSAAKFGPYLSSIPVNPLTNGSKIKVIDAAVGDLRRDGHGGTDFVYHTPTGRFWMVTAEGSLLNETSEVVWDSARATPEAKLASIRRRPAPTSTRPPR